jgi:hypothetical protein
VSLADDSALQERVRKLLDCCEMRNVHLLKMSAERFTPQAPTSVLISSSTAYAVDEESFANKIQWEAKLTREEDVVAEISATFWIDYEVREGFVPDAEAAEAIATTTGFFAAYPYVREFFQSTCARLQLDPLVLGMLLAGSTEPRSISNPIAESIDRLPG